MADAVHIPEIPRTTRGHREKDHVKNIMFRMGDEFVEALDFLCGVNKRSRREIVEILICEAYIEVQQDETARIDPI